MILLVAFIAALIISILCGGSLRNLAQVRIRAGWVAIGAFAVQGWVIYVCEGPVSRPWDWRGGLLVASYLLLGLFIYLNRHLPGVYLFALGLFLNFTVIVANGGFMPVTPEALQRAHQSGLVDRPEEWVKVRNTKDIILRRENTRLWFLSDVFVLPPPSPLTSVFSIGDLCIGVGVFYFFFNTLVLRR